jgi:hypothetical protein
VSRSIAKTDDRDRPDDRRTGEWRETFETLEAGERIRAALTPAGPASDCVR